MTDKEETKEQTSLEKTREAEVEQKKSKMQTIGEFLTSDITQEKIARKATKSLDTQMLVGVAITAMEKNTKLLNCTQGSLLQACMDCASFGLYPSSNINEAHLVPFGNQCVLIIGYKGMIKLATNTGLVSGVKVRRVHANDEFDYELGLNERLVHKPAVSDPGEFIGAYAIVAYKDGTQDFRYVSKEEGIDHGKRFSKNFSSKDSTWKLDQAAMVCKTAVRMVLKYVPVSAEPLTVKLQEAVSRDEIMETKGALNFSLDPDPEPEIPGPEPLDIDPKTGEVLTDEEKERQESLKLDAELAAKDK